MSDDVADPRSRGISTVDELKRLYADRDKDPPAPELGHPRPSWVDDPYDDNRRHIRMRERRIRFLEERLGGRLRGMEQNYDRNA